MNILVTAFGKFTGVVVNPTEFILRRLQKRRRARSDFDIQFGLLPCAYAAAGDQAIDLIRKHRPDRLLLLGVGPAGPSITLERIALNLDDCPIPDNEGVVRQATAIRRGGPDRHTTPFHLQSLVAKMEAYGVSTSISSDPGSYLCNHTYFRVLDCGVTDALTVPDALFVHVPLLLAERDARVLDYKFLLYLERAVDRLILEIARAAVPTGPVVASR